VWGGEGWRVACSCSLHRARQSPGRPARPEYLTPLHGQPRQSRGPAPQCSFVDTAIPGLGDATELQVGDLSALATLEYL
jgi:hypothetical protein